MSFEEQSIGTNAASLSIKNKKRIAKPRTILQLNSTPFSIDVSEYSNPHSSDNPTGDYRAAYRLSRLADPIPQLETYYTDSLNSSEKVWVNIINMNDSKSEINLNTTIKKIYVDVLRVDFIRNWLNFEILESSQWSIAGLEKGYFSTGEINENNGIFPLIIKSMLIGTKVTFEGNFDKKDIDAINKCKVNKSLSIGPFLLNTETEDVVVEEKNF